MKTNKTKLANQEFRLSRLVILFEGNRKKIYFLYKNTAKEKKATVLNM